MGNITLEYVVENYNECLEKYAQLPHHDKGLVRHLERKNMPEKLHKALERNLEKLAYHKSKEVEILPATTEVLVVEDVTEANYENLQETANKITNAIFDENGNQKIADADIDTAVGDAVQKAVAISHAIEKQSDTLDDLQRQRNKKRGYIEKLKLEIAKLEKQARPDLEKIAEKKNALGQAEAEKKTLDIRIDGYKAK